MNEDTIVKTLSLPYGQEWLWIADANMVILSPCLDEVGRQKALCEVSAHWRRCCLRVVGEGNVVGEVSDEPGPPTEPFRLPWQATALSMESQ